MLLSFYLFFFPFSFFLSFLFFSSYSTHWLLWIVHESNSHFSHAVFKLGCHFLAHAIKHERWRSRVSGRNGMHCLLLSLHPSYAAASFNISPLCLRSASSSTCSILIYCAFGIWQRKIMSFYCSLFSFSSSSPFHLPLSVSQPSLISRQHSNLFKQLRGIWGNSCYSCWSNKDPSEW